MTCSLQERIVFNDWQPFNHAQTANRQATSILQFEFVAELP